MITVKTSSSKERDDEIKELFDKMKPYLDEGYSYHKALNEIKQTNVSYAQRRWYRDLVEYGESQGYPYKEFKYPNDYEHKYGLYNVQLMKHQNSLTGYYWIYRYVDELGNRRSVSDMDLCKLRDRVKEKGLKWEVTDEDKLVESVEINEELLHKMSKKKVRTSSGVKYVSKVKSGQVRRGFYWGYCQKNKKVKINLSSGTLSELKQRVEDKGLEWIIIDENVYANAIESDIKWSETE